MKGNLPKWLWILAFVTALLPTIINILYLCGEGLSKPNTVFKAVEILQYYSGAIIGVGTIYLAHVALRQNDRFFSESERIRKVDFAATNYCLFKFESDEIRYIGSSREDKIQKFIQTGCNGKMAFWKYAVNPGYETMSIRIKVTNIGNAVAVNGVIIDDSIKQKAVLCNVVHTDNETHDKKYIEPNDSGLIIICVSIDEYSNRDFYLEFSNQFGSKYRQKIEFRSLHNIITVSTNITLEIMDDSDDN